LRNTNACDSDYTNEGKRFRSHSGERNRVAGSRSIPFDWRLFSAALPFEKEEDERSCKRDDVVRRLDSLRTPDALAHIAWGRLSSM
jgi:hypothetical protein